jgi:hypothetical protein
MAASACRDPVDVIGALARVIFLCIVGQAIVDFLNKNWDVISGAPWTFISLVVFIATVMFLVSAWWHRGTMNAKDATIENLKERATSHEKEIERLRIPKLGLVPDPRETTPVGQLQLPKTAVVGSPKAGPAMGQIAQSLGTSPMRTDATLCDVFGCGAPSTLCTDGTEVDVQGLGRKAIPLIYVCGHHSNWPHSNDAKEFSNSDTYVARCAKRHLAD